MKLVFSIFFIFLFITSCKNFSKLGSRQLKSETQDSSRHPSSNFKICQAKQIPSVSSIERALNNFSLDVVETNHQIFLDFGNAVKNFTTNFLNTLPSDCSSSALKSALNTLEKEHEACNSIDATKVYVKRIKNIFDQVAQHTEKNKKKEIVNHINSRFVSMMGEHYPLDEEISPCF